jgi:FG-GAP-like repeat/Abnormal spindle-like microcephaly-assoc'd, ASPM-SPD-2-Hydin
MPSVSLRRAAILAVCALALQQAGWAAAFKGAPTFPAHLAPDAIVVADFNGDGNLDIAIANRNSNDISVLLGKGNGTFSAQVKYSSGGTEPVSIAAADFNGDNKPDLVVVNYASNNVAVLMNTGTGTFSAAVKYTVGRLPAAVVAGDLTGNGINDLAVANSQDNTISVLINNGTGTFSIGSTLHSDSSPVSITMADFDGNGFNDLAVADQGGNDVSVLLNQGAGSFAAAVNYCVVVTSGACASVAAVNPVSLVAVVLTSSGKPDLAVASLSQSVVTLVNSGTGTFTLTGQSNSSMFPQAIAAGDLNNDGHQDLVVADYSTNSFEVYLGTGNGSLPTAVRFLTGLQPIAIATGDFNNDGKPDVAVVNNGENDVTVALGNGDGTFQDIESFISGGNVRSIALGDFNNDGKTDFVVNSSSNGYSVNLFIGNGKGGFQLAANVPLANDVYSIAVGDFNQDKNLDFVTANQTANQITVVFGNGNGTFNPTVATYATDGGPVSVAVADLNGDGYPDIVTANSAGNDLTIFLNNKTGGFVSAGTIPVGFDPSAVALGDLNNDGIQDIVVTNAASSTITVLLGKGDGIFSAGVNYNVGNTPSAVTLADVNGDHFADIIVTNKLDDTVSVLIGNGDGTFRTAVSYVIPGSTPLGIAAADITADGILDLVVAESSGSMIGVLPGNGDGTFQGSVNYKTEVTPFAVAAVDLNGDGKIDVLSANDGSGDVSVLMNQSPAAIMSASSGKLIFGNVQVGASSSAQTLTLTNKGNLALNLYSVTTSASFPMTTNCGTTLLSGASCTVTITYSPTVPGAVIGQVTFAGSVTGDYLIIPLTGTGQFPMAVLPLSIKFAATAVGKTSAAQTVTVYNQLSTAQSFSFATTANYNVSGSGTNPCTGTLAGNSNCTVSVTLSPTQSGAINGSFIVSGSGFVPQITSLSGTGTGGPVLPLSFSPTGLLFDSPALGFSSLPKTVTATNTTASALNLTLNASTDWVASGSGNKPCGGTLAAGANCTFAVVFTPSVLGYFNGSVLIGTGSGNPIVYDLEGLGNLDSSFTPSLIQFPAQNVGTTSPGVIVKVWNFENTNMTVLGWYASGDFSAVPGGNQPCIVNGQVPPLQKPYCTLVVSFSPTKLGVINGAITVTTGWATGAESLPVTGTGQ